MQLINKIKKNINIKKNKIFSCLSIIIFLFIIFFILYHLVNNILFYIMNKDLIKFYKNNNIYSITENILLPYSKLEKNIYELYKDFNNNSVKIIYKDIFHNNSNEFKKKYDIVNKKYLQKNTYLSDYILSKVKDFNNSTYLINYIFNIEDIHVNINIYTYNIYQKINYRKYLNKIILYFKIIYSLIKPNCMSNGCNIYLFLTDAKKQFFNFNNKNILNSTNINTGFCFGCKKTANIIIYREEECIKVFAHELLHASGVDNNLFNINNNFIKKYLNLKESVIKNLNLNECWIEYCATIIYLNIEGITYCLNKKLNIKKFILDLYKLELSHFMFQASKILNYYNLDYGNLLINQTNNYDEKTHAFSYYILKMILFYNKNIVDKVLEDKLFNLSENKYVSLLKVILENIKKNEIFINKMIFLQNKMKKNNNIIYTNLRFLSFF